MLSRCTFDHTQIQKNGPCCGQLNLHHIARVAGQKPVQCRPPPVHAKGTWTVRGTASRKPWIFITRKKNIDQFFEHQKRAAF